MRYLLAVALLVSCRSDARVSTLEAHLADIQRRVGALESQRDEVRAARDALQALGVLDATGQIVPTWWCTAERCERTRTEGAAPAAIAWCPLGSEGQCRPTPCEGCVGVR